MCGIAGYHLPLNAAHLIPKGLNIETLPTVLRHRGPDSNGSWFSDRRDLYFFHARLSIQDLSPLGYQPMVSHCERLCISFNGEIYNFHELSRCLKSAGVILRGHSDTEVFLEYIARFGLDKALKVASGMFAFSLYDRVAETLYLVRDRIGEKPLYWYFDRGILAWCSEIKGLEAMLGSLGDIDRIALGQYFRYGYVPEPRSIYKKVRKLTPGTMLVIPVGRSVPDGDCSLDNYSARHSQVYWNLNEIRAEGMRAPFQNRADAIQEIQRLIETNIANQSIADVDVGVFLSGGIDSTLVTALLQRQCGTPVKSFTVGFDVPAFNEAAFSRALSAHLGTIHHELTVSESDLLAQVELLPEVYDEPLANPAQIPMMLLSKYAREHVKVSLSGDGGDELFGGYNRYLWGSRVARFNQQHSKVVRQCASTILALIARLPSSIRAVMAAFQKGPVQNVEGKLRKAATALNLNEKEALYDFLLVTGWAENPVLGHFEQYVISHDSFQNESFIDAAMFSDQLHYLPGDNLAKVDRASMAASLEVRLPLLSHDLVSQAWRVPVSMRVANDQSKSLLRQILYQYVPRNLVERPKMGFSVPIAKWLRKDLREWSSDLVYSSVLQSVEDVLDVELIKEVWTEHVDGKSDHASKIWPALVFLQWKLGH